jgi:hypothetical protein
VLRVSCPIRIGKRIVLETHQQNQLNMEMKALKGHNYEDGCPACEQTPLVQCPLTYPIYPRLFCKTANITMNHNFRSFSLAPAPSNSQPAESKRIPTTKPGATGRARPLVCHFVPRCKHSLDCGSSRKRLQGEGSLLLESKVIGRLRRRESFRRENRFLFG